MNEPKKPAWNYAYCRACGRKLEYRCDKTGKFDQETGEPEVTEYFACPRSTGLLWWLGIAGRHTSQIPARNVEAEE